MTGGGDKKVSEIAKREEAILAFWNEHRIFEKTLDPDKATKGEYVFYDGPPFATGLPHYGHLLQSFVKDVVPRYKTMCGYRVERQWGWDCHGLPIETLVEKELGTKSKKDIVQMGVKKFNDLCRERIFTFIGEWERIIPRVGRFVDMEHAYRTMDFSYMESEWWAFKTLHDKGLIYEDYRSMHICPRCETTLSQGEVAEGYKDVKDLSATVKFKIKPGQKIGDWEMPENTYLLAWTTTPWTLPGNVALAVGAKIQYSLTNQEGFNVIVKNEGKGEILNKGVVIVDKEFSGNDLIGLEYEPLFDYYAKNEKLKNRENGWKVYAADFVTTDAGTGIVHIAPAFGADDMALGKEKQLPFVQHVKMDGTFVEQTGEFAGLDLKPRAKGKPEEIREADLTIVRHLEEKGALFSSEKYEHSYPHCWRCDTALLNYATSSWFVAVEKMKPTLLETAQSINWSPEHIKDGRFGKWLEGARDWSISRQRFWANTIPVWRCQLCKKDQVFGGVAELEKASGAKVEDLHKEVVDLVEVPCECGGMAQRVPDVLDTWFDSGSVPFASQHYPFENTDRFTARETADFIGEAQDQARAWFYYLHVLSGGLFEKPAYKNVIVTGLVLAEDGKKMSKKLKNYPDPMDVVDKYGADAMRMYILSSPVVQAENLSFAEKGVDEVAKKNIGRLHNVLAFYELYADGTVRDHTSTDVLDRWILSRLAQLVDDTTAGLETYQLDIATRPIAGFIDDLSVWYLRRSRDRFKTDGEDKANALKTLRYVLHTLARVIAPTMPFYAEHLFQAAREEEDEESVHLSMWPAAAREVEFNAELTHAMQEARRVVSLALEARESAQLNVRKPLLKLSIPRDVYEALPERDALLSIVAAEVNVKEVEPADLKSTTIELDLTMNDELREEGLMRELVRYVQGKRKEMQLVPSDKIRLTILESEAAYRHEAEIGKSLNASEIVYSSEWQGIPLKLEEGDIVVGIEKLD